MKKTSFQLEVPELDELIQQNEQNLYTVNAIARETTREVSEWAYDEMRRGLARHIDTGAAYHAVKVSVKSDTNNRFEMEVGIPEPGTDDRKEGYYHAMFQEYGSPTTRVDPWFRPVRERLNKKAKEIIARKLRERGIAK